MKHAMMGSAQKWIMVICLTFALTTPQAISQTAGNEAINLPSQALSSALTTLGATYGVTIIAPGELTEGKTAPALSGTMTSLEAVSQVLKGSSLDAGYTRSGAIVISKAAVENPTSPAQALAPAPVPRTVEEVVVFGSVTRFNVPLTETPQAVTVISADLFQRQGAISIEETLRYVPSVQAELAGRQGFDDFLIRGFSQSRYQFRDGLRLDPGFLQQQEPWGLEAVQVLKGPASVLYGQIAPGGLVNMVGKTARPERIRDVGLTVGSYGLFRGFADIGGALDSDERWSARLPVVIQERDDVQDFVGSSRIFAAPSLTWSPSKSTDLTLFTLYQNDEYDRTTGLPLAGTINPNPNGTIPASRFLGEPSVPQLESEQWQVGYMLRHRFSSAIEYRSKLRYSDFQLDGPIVQAPRPGSTDSLVNRRGFVFTGDRQVLTLDNQIEAVFQTGSIEHRIVTGFDYQRYDDKNSGDLFGLPPIDPFNPVYGAQPEPIGPFFAADNQLTQLGIYSQYRAKIAERFVAVVGGRYSESDNELGNPDTGSRRSQEDEEFTFNTALMYLAPAGFSPYISYAESFEPQIGFDPLSSGEQPPPSLGDQFELGLRWQSKDGRLQATLSAFRIDQTNIVNFDPDNPGFSVLVGEQQHDGAEIEITGQATDALRIFAGYSYLDAEITSSNNGDEGQRPLNVPEHAGSVFATLDGSVFGFDQAELSAGVRYVGERRANEAGDMLPDYTLVDLAARYSFGNITLGINAKNIFDERYFTAGGVRAVIDGEPRVLQMTVQAGF